MIDQRCIELLLLWLLSGMWFCIGLYVGYSHGYTQGAIDRMKQEEAWLKKVNGDFHK